MVSIYLIYTYIMNLKNKIVIVTWASEWIGKEIALSLAKTWCSLALIARNAEKLEQVKVMASELWATRVEKYPCDISKTDILKKSLENVFSDLWWIDVLINNAGIWQKLTELDEIPSERIDQLIATNLTWLIHATRICLPVLRTRPEAAIINISSKAWHVAQKNLSVYCATKFWVRGFTEVLKIDLKDTPVRVAWVYQSGTNTAMFEKTWEDFPVENFTDPKDLADMVTHMLWLPEKMWVHDVRVSY